MVDRELLTIMRNAGCFAVWLGVESGSELILGAMNKKIKIDQTKKSYKTAHQVGLMTIANVVLGFPGETEQTALETIKLVKELNPDDVGFYIATPYQGHRCMIRWSKTVGSESQTLTNTTLRDQLLKPLR